MRFFDQPGFEEAIRLELASRGLPDTGSACAKIGMNVEYWECVFAGIQNYKQAVAREIAKRS